MGIVRRIKKGIRLVGRWLTQIVAATLILLALLVGVARLLLPEAVEFKEEIRAGVLEATGFQIDFAMISAGLSVYGPELRFADTSIKWPDGSDLATADAIAVSLDVLGLLTRGVLVPGRVYIEGVSVDATIAPDGRLIIQGHPWRDFLPPETAGPTPEIPEVRLQLANIPFSFKNMQRNGPRIAGVVKRFDAGLDDERIAITAAVDPGSMFGKSIEIEADIPQQLVIADQEMQADMPWDLRVDVDGLQLDNWLEITQIAEFPVMDSDGDAEARVAFRGMRPLAVAAKLRLSELKLAQPGDVPVLINRLTGDLDWRLIEGGWQASGEGLRIEREESVWPDSAFFVRRYAGPEAGREHITVNATFLRAEDLQPFLQALIPLQLQEAGFSGSVTGDLTDLGLELFLQEEQVESFELDARFANVGYSSFEQGYELSGFSGRVAADNGGGNLEINTRDARFGVAQLFRDVLDVSRLEGLAIWRAGPEGYRVLADGIDLETPDGSANASLELSLDKDFGNPVVDISAEARLDVVAAAPRYLPKVLPPKVLDWLDVALVAGRVESSDIRMQGPLKKFPFPEDEGIFKIGVNFVDGALNYAPEWPLAEQLSGRLVFDGPGLYSTENSGAVAGLELSNMDVRIDDLRKGVLELNGSGPIRLENLLIFLQQSPVGDALGPVFAEVQANGAADASLDLKLPIKSLADWELDGRIKTRDAEAGLATLKQRFTAINGSARIRNTQVSAAELTAQLLDEPVTIAVEPITIPDARFSHRASVTGVMPVSKIQTELGIPESRLLDGEINITAQALFPSGAPSGGEFSLLLRSDLVGLSSRFPYPLNKAKAQTEGLQLELTFPERGTTHIYGSMKRGLSWSLEAVNQADGWDLTRGTIQRDVLIPAMPEEDGLTLAGQLDSLDLDAWTTVLGESEPAIGQPQTASGWQKLFRSADVQIGELFAIGHRFVDVDADVLFGPDDWDIRVAGPWTEGDLDVPYDFRGQQPVVLEMERLLLIEPRESGSNDSDAQLDPRTLPGIRGQVKDFALGNLRLGLLDVDVRRIPGGLKSARFSTQSPSFNTEVSYDWLVVDNAQRSRLHLELRSNDVEKTLVKLGYAPLVRARRGRVTADLLWEGGPGMNSVYASTGKIDLSIRDGSVAEVDAGGGRILGLLSVTSLPRRFALDFKDISEDGLAFDKINGGFRIDFGNAWTCNLGLEGSVADMGIVGRTGIQAQDYDQVAAIRPHVSNLAPVAGAFLAGPTVGIATLLITQIMKKPLSSIGESYYQVTGGWDDPLFVKVDRDDLDTTSFGDCDKQLPTLSPEEIEAIEELINNPAALTAEPPVVPPTTGAPAAEGPAQTSPEVFIGPADGTPE